MVRIAALLTCFNRKPLTLQCLRCLSEQLIEQQQEQEAFSLSIYMVDDGSTDGTAEAVRQQFPDVHIISGSGSLFWNGGMRLAWQTALDEKYDFYLWINDDSAIYPDAISRLLADYQTLQNQQQKTGAITGTLIDPASKAPIYGGHKTRTAFYELLTRLVAPAETPQPCDFINGNITLIPAASVEAIGILNKAYKHGYGDYDYSCRLKKAGFSCWVGSGIYGECAANTLWSAEESKPTIARRLEDLRKVERLFPYQDQMYFARHCSGKFWPIWWFRAWLRGNFPLLWVLTTPASHKL